jgi:hypothetical protein
MAGNLKLIAISHLGAPSSAIQMIFDTGQWLALAVIREIANLTKPDAGQDECAISTFSFDLMLFQAQCLNDPLKEQHDSKILNNQ